LAKILASFAQTAATFCKNLIITLVFEKNAIFSPKIGKKSPKIVIITSTPAHIWSFPLQYFEFFTNFQEHQKLLTVNTRDGELSAHFFCLAFSSGLGQRGDESEGLQVLIQLYTKAPYFWRLLSHMHLLSKFLLFFRGKSNSN
jgi:hypothetical protein